MEYEIYRSKLKPLTNCTLIRTIIETSSSGEHPHHSVALGLIIEKSIQEHRKRTLEKVKNDSQPGSKPEPEARTEAPTTSTPQAKPLAPEPGSQSVSQSSSSSALASASAKTEAPADSSILSEPGKEAKVGCLEEPPTYLLLDPFCHHSVNLPCSSCNSITSLSGKRLSLHMRRPGRLSFNCTSCQMEWVHGTYTCTKCCGGLQL